MSSLVPCPGCARHVRVDEPSCPFCGADGGLGRASPDRRSLATRLTRALIFAGATAALVTCGDEPIAQPYGAPPEPDHGGETPPPESDPQQPGQDAGTGQAAPADPGQPMALYGGPPS